MAGADQSILDETKKTLGLAETYNAFDHDVLTHINSALFTLSQLGIGPDGGLFVEDKATKWTEFGDFREKKAMLGALKSYVYLHTRRAFDPPQSPHHVTAMNDQIDELIHRLHMERELIRWPR